jgi:hypothetical protein
MKNMPSHTGRGGANLKASIRLFDAPDGFEPEVTLYRDTAGWYVRTFRSVFEFARFAPEVSEKICAVAIHFMDEGVSCEAMERMKKESFDGWID